MDFDQIWQYLLLIFGGSGLLWQFVSKEQLKTQFAAYIGYKTDTNTPSKAVSKVLDANPDMYVMCDEDKALIQSLCVDGEWAGVSETIRANENEKTYRYTIEGAKFTATIEQGFPTIKYKDAFGWRVISDVNGDLIGLFDILGISSDSKGKKPLTQISRSGPNYAYLRYKVTSVGVINPGIQVGDEDILWLGTDADTSEELATVRTEKFQIWTYPATVEEDTVEIKTFKGYETKGTGTKETELKKIEGSTVTYNIAVVD